MHLKFNRLSISSIINGLYAIALLKIDPKHLMPFINKCQKYFKEKDRMLFSENDVVNYEKSIILNLYFKENNINLYINQSQKSQVECKLIESCSDQTEETSNEISDYLSKIFEYPRNHLCHEKVNHSDSDDYVKHYKKHVDLIEKNEIFHAETYKYKFMYKKINFNRYEKTIRKGFVKNGIGNCVNIIIEPTVYFEGKFCYDRMDKNFGFKTKEIFIVFIKPEDYFMGKIRRDLMFCIENAQKRADVILLDLEEYKKRKFTYFNQLLSSILPAAEIDERVKEFDSLFTKTEVKTKRMNHY